MTGRLAGLLLLAALLAAAGWWWWPTAAGPAVSTATAATATSAAPAAVALAVAPDVAPAVLQPSDFIARMEALQRAGDNQALAHGRDQLLAEAGRLQMLTAGGPAAVALLEQWLDRFPRDLLVWQALSDHLQQAGRQQAAVTALLMALQTTQQPDEQAPLRARLRLLADALASQQRSQGAASAAADLYRQLIDGDPLHSPWRVAAVRAAAAAGDRAAAAEHLALLPEWEVPAGTWAELQALAAAPDVPPSGLPAGSTRVLERGQQPLVPVTVAGRRLRLVVDTGATLTTLKAASVVGLVGLRDSGRQVRMRTAGGDRIGQLVQAGQVVLGGRVLGPREVAVLDLDGLTDADGLLGMDVLRAYTLQRVDGALWLVPADR